MARYYVRRSPLRWMAGLLIALIGIALAAHYVAEWLLPFIPLAGAGLLTIVLVRVGFRRR